jgi:hypothetical protein
MKKFYDIDPKSKKMFRIWFDLFNGFLGQMLQNFFQTNKLDRLSLISFQFIILLTGKAEPTWMDALQRPILSYSDIDYAVM